MKSEDRRLGMGADITRRDFLNGVGIAVGASLLPGCSGGEAPAGSEYYPPALTGLRGSHPGSFEAAHAIVQGGSWQASPTGEEYDVIVVGAGISGLASAYIYHRDVDPNARILILDNHDDFGGHAKRNEFTIDGRTIIGFGGTMQIDSGNAYPVNARRVMDELGFDANRRDETHNWDLYASQGMGQATFFDKATFGADHLAKGGRTSAPDLSDAPLSEEGKQQVARLHADEHDYLDGMSNAERLEVMRTHSYRDYLARHGGFGDEALTYIQKYSHGLWSTGADALPAITAWLVDYPGFGGMQLDLGLSDSDEDGEDGGGIFHFPDGNASVARLLVRKLVPNAASGNTMDDIVTARFDYGQLDQPDNNARIRLNSTVVDLHHRDGDLDARVDVTYVNDGEARSVTATRVVWAGYHAIVPYICPDLPDKQVAALKSSVRSPLVYTNVLIRNWRSFVDLGFWRAYCPGSFFQSVRIDFPVSIGEYAFSSSPDDPVVLHLQHIPTRPGLPAPDQFRAGRQWLLETGFDTFEREVRDQLGRMLGPGGFDSARDIAAITVNRWPHGYAFSVDAERDEVAWWPQIWPYENKPWVDSRQRVGNISFAGTDSASDAMTEAALEEAYRAVHDLAGEKSL